MFPLEAKEITALLLIFDAKKQWLQTMVSRGGKIGNLPKREIADR